jgi:uroporphyrin-III C-methyltransferase
MNETPPPPASLPAPVPRPAPRRSDDSAARVLAALALVATAAALWIAVDTRMSVQSMESSAGGRLAELGAQSQGAKAALAQVQASVRDAQARVAELEARVADTQEQRVALEEMYRELSRSADDRVLSEVEQMLVAASHQLQLAGNVRSALAALQAADQRLARAEKLASTPLRRAITQDMERLRSVPQVDTVGIAVKLDGLIQQVESLPMLIAESPPQPRAARLRAPDDEGAVGRWARVMWEDMKGLVRIRELDTPEPQLLSPAQAYFLRENLKLRLLAARVSLLARDEPSFREDLRATQAWIAKYFDVKSRPAAAAIATLKQVAETPIAIATPDINASLGAVRAARAAREKGR